MLKISGTGLIFPAVLLLFMITAAHAETYRWVDANGAISFSDNYNDIPARYRQQAQIVAEPGSYNVMPGKSSAGKVRAGAEGSALTGVVKAKSKPEARMLKKHAAGKPEKPRKHGRHAGRSPEIVTTPARQAQDKIEGQLRNDRQKLDDAGLPARRMMEQNEEQLRKTRDSISGH